MFTNMQAGERTTKDKRLQNSNMKRKGTYCAALWCNNNFGSNPPLSLFRIPREKQRATQWLESAGREDILERGPTIWHSKYLCEEHFTDRMFMNEERKKLVWNAIPTIFPQPPSSLKKIPPSTDEINDILNQQAQHMQQVNKALRKILPKPITQNSGEALVKDNYPGSSACTDENLATFCALTTIPENKNSQLMNETVNKISLVESNETNEIDESAPRLPDFKDANLEPYNFISERSYEKAYPCSSCGEMFLFKNSLIAHEATYHPECYSVTEHQQNSK